MSLRSALRTIAEHKRDEIHTASPEDLVFDVVEQMTKLNIGAMIILNADGAVAGIFTERDLLTRVVAEGLDVKTTKMSEVMTPDPQCVEASMTVEDAMRRVTEQRIRHLPLTTGGKLEGVISSGDLTVWALRAREAEVAGLSQKLKKHKAVIALIIGFALLIIIGIASN